MQTTQPQQIEIELNAPQWRMMQSGATETMFISGRGGGKSFGLGQWVMQRAAVKNSIGLLAAPTHDVVRQSTFPQVQESWEKVGIYLGAHYVVNEAPPEQWGVKPFSPVSNNRVITFIWGAYCILDTLDNINKARGAEYDYIAIDEFRDVKFSEVRKVLRASLRGREFKKTGRPHQMLWVSTPPDNPRELNELLASESHISLVEGTSYDNRGNLPQGFIEGLEASYDPVTAQREIYGKRVMLGSQRPFMYCFDEGHISDLPDYDPRFPLYLSFDFNVNPCTCLIGQHGRDEYGAFINFIDEIFLHNADIYDVCNLIKARYPQANYMVTGDRSGMNRTALKKNLNYYVVIKQELSLRESQFKLPANPHFNESLVLCNSILARHPRVRFHRTRCKETIFDMMFVQWDGQKPVKEDRSKREQQADLFDATRYYLNTWFNGYVKKGSN